MTKAEKIFQNMLKDANTIILDCGHEKSKERNYAIRFNTEGAGDGFYCQRTVNAVEKEVEKYIKNVKRNYRFGVIDYNALMVEVEVVRLLWTGVNAGQAFVDELKAYKA